jgi:hypothetical protein
MNKLLATIAIVCATSSGFLCAATNHEATVAEQRTFSKSVEIRIINNSGTTLDGLTAELEIRRVNDPVFTHRFNLTGSGQTSPQRVNISIPEVMCGDSQRPYLVSASNTIIRLVDQHGTTVQDARYIHSYDLDKLNTLTVNISPFTPVTDGNMQNLDMYKGITITSNLD